MMFVVDKAVLLREFINFDPDAKFTALVNGNILSKLATMCTFI